MNTQIQDIKKIFRVITVLLITGTLLTPFIFSGDMFFPYITGKAFFMRLMILLTTISYTGLALVDKNSRPKKSYMLYAMIAFMAILCISAFTSVNPTRSIWSNFERMEGLVTMLYMGALFVMSSATLRKREWPYLLNVSLLMSVVVGINALLSATTAADRISGHLGNSSYLGVYALIHIFFSLLAVLMVFRGNKERELIEAGTNDHGEVKIGGGGYAYIAVYAILGLFNTYILYHTGTRGAFVGLVVGLFLSSIYLAFKEKNKIVKSTAIAFLTIVVATVFLLGTLKSSDFVKSNSLLSRFAALITTDYKSVLNNEGNARTMIWKMAFEGVKERPLLGWGQDNFGYVFAKYYNPQMYGQEQWFDRSHNVFMDWLISAGFLGLIGYLSLFAFALYFIFSKKSQFTVIEKSIFLGLLASYFVHNMFVFDNLSSYVLFFLILGYINDRYTHDRHEKESANAMTEHQVNMSILIGLAALAGVSYVGYQTLLKPFTQSSGLLSILRDMQQGAVPPNLDKRFAEVLDDGPTGKFETFEQLSTTLPRIAAQDGVSVSTKQNLLTVYQKQVGEYDKTLGDDARYNYFVSNTYRTLGAQEPALLYINKAYALSPQKQTFAYSKALVMVNGNDVEGAAVLLKKAYEDAPQNETAFGYYLSILIESAKRAGYSQAKLAQVSEVSVAGYKTNGHDFVLRKEYWDLIGDRAAKNIVIQKTIELLPEQKAKIMEVAK